MRRLAAAALALPIVLTTWAAWARLRDEPVPAPRFRLAPGFPVGGPAPAAPAPAYLTGGRIAALADGALVIDADSGDLVRTDATGAPIARVPVGRDAGVLAYDPVAARAFVADRRGDRILVVRASAAGDLAVAATWRTPVEPYGVALAPDRATLLVACVADRTLVAYDVSTGAERWRAGLAREPRGVAIAPDGTRAVVAHLGAGLAETVDLATAGHAVVAEPLGTGEIRGAETALFLGSSEVVVPFQVEVPVNPDPETQDSGHYGGTPFAPPITSDLAFVGLAGARHGLVQAEIADQQVRALAWDPARDALYLAGRGTDSLLEIRHASQIDPSDGVGARLTIAGERCGPDGLAVAPRGDVLVWCAFSRRVERLARGGKPGAALTRSAGPAVAPSALTPAQHAGMVVFHVPSARISEQGAVACASCHLEGRADGLSWAIEGKRLQTPLLAGRLVGTAPFKWDGAAPSLTASIHATVTRLGGSGLPAAQTAELVAYLEQLPAVRTPARPADAVARGKALFESEGLACASCHDGAAYTDQLTHRLAGSLTQVDTPSLVGLAASAPYFHDGSAPTLEALLRDRGGVHGMADDARRLDDAQIRDLAAFLETL